jgi:hypothetical protein
VSSQRSKCSQHHDSAACASHVMCPPRILRQAAYAAAGRLQSLGKFICRCSCHPPTSSSACICNAAICPRSLDLRPRPVSLRPWLQFRHLLEALGCLQHQLELDLECLRAELCLQLLCARPALKHAQAVGTGAAGYTPAWNLWLHVHICQALLHVCGCQVGCCCWRTLLAGAAGCKGGNPLLQALRRGSMASNACSVQACRSPAACEPAEGLQNAYASVSRCFWHHLDRHRNPADPRCGSSLGVS